jgi:predicted transposase YbfD/YdcC
MGTQRKIVKEINKKGADYTLSLKENQPSFLKKSKELFENNPVENLSSYIEDESRQHGRSEKREYYLTDIPNHFTEKHVWENISSIGMVKRERLVNGHHSSETAYYITSLQPNDIKKFSKSVRDHWGVENNLHWQLDVTFHEDLCRKRKGDSATNFSILRRLVLNLLKKEKTCKRGINIKRHKAGWDNDYLLKVLGIK